MGGSRFHVLSLVRDSCASGDPRSLRGRIGEKRFLQISVNKGANQVSGRVLFNDEMLEGSSVDLYGSSSSTQRIGGGSVMSEKQSLDPF